MNEHGYACGLPLPDTDHTKEAVLDSGGRAVALPTEKTILLLFGSDGRTAPFRCKSKGMFRFIQECGPAPSDSRKKSFVFASGGRAIVRPAEFTTTFH